MGSEVRDPLGGGGGWGPALTCRDRQLGVDLVHEHLPAGLDHDDLGEAGAWSHRAAGAGLGRCPHPTALAAVGRVCESSPWVAPTRTGGGRVPWAHAHPRVSARRGPWAGAGAEAPPLAPSRSRRGPAEAQQHVGWEGPQAMPGARCPLQSRGSGGGHLLEGRGPSRGPRRHPPSAPQPGSASGSSGRSRRPSARTCAARPAR